MAKTIKELAEEQFPITKWEEAWAANNCRRIFCLGANSVLKEIEQIIAVGCDDVSFDIILRGRIKELKKEEI